MRHQWQPTKFPLFQYIQAQKPSAESLAYNIFGSISDNSLWINLSFVTVLSPLWLSTTPFLLGTGLDLFSVGSNSIGITVYGLWNPLSSSAPSHKKCRARGHHLKYYLVQFSTTRGTTRYYYYPGSNLNFHSRASLRHTLRLELSWAGPMFGNVSSPSNLSLPILVKSHQPGLSLICFIISTSSQGPENSKSFCAPRCNLSHPSSLEFAAPWQICNLRLLA